MGIGVSFDVVHTFEDALGNQYKTDEWNEEDIDVEVDDMEHETIVNKIISSATEHAKYLIIECRRYDYVNDEIDEEDEVEPIKGLKLVRTHIKRMRYDDIEIKGCRVVNL